MPGLVEPMDRRAHLIENLRRHNSLKELQASSFFARHGEEIAGLLHTPRIWRNPSAAPRIASFLRIAAWNVEKGKHPGRIVELFRSHPVLRSADVIVLNEVDNGMARSGNFDVGRHLADELGMHLVFGAAHIELTKGTGEDLEATLENADSLQGNAVLTRHAVLEARAIALPACFEPFEFHEKRYGARNCVWARLKLGDGTLWLGSAHLEVRKTPACRAVQMRALLAQLPGESDEAHIIAGDFNTSGFGRGTRRHTIGSVCRLLARSAPAMQESLCHPERRSEPLFRHARAAGFEWVGLNSFEPTACTPIDSLEDAALLPRPIVRLVTKRLEPYGGFLRFKLDWILGKGVIPLRADEAYDTGSGEFSRSAGCIETDNSGLDRISDHRPVFADIRLPVAG